MVDCHSVQENLTAWVDGELSPRWTKRVECHLETCTDCSMHAAAVRHAITQHRRALPRLLAAEDFDPQPLQQRLRQAVAMQAEADVGIWAWFLRPVFRPVALASAALVFAFVLFVWIAGGPQAVLIPLGLESPPAAVVRQPDLFRDYPLIEHLDVLEHFETVESMPVDDQQAAVRS